MLKLKAVLLNTYKSNGYTDKETGVTTKGRNKLQLLIEKPLKNGGVKKELLDLSIPEEKLSKYLGMENKQVKVEVSYFGNCDYTLCKYLITHAILFCVGLSSKALMIDTPLSFFAFICIKVVFFLTIKLYSRMYFDKVRKTR